MPCIDGWQASNTAMEHSVGSQASCQQACTFAEQVYHEKHIQAFRNLNCSTPYREEDTRHPKPTGQSGP